MELTERSTQGARKVAIQVGLILGLLTWTVPSQAEEPVTPDPTPENQATWARAEADKCLASCIELGECARSLSGACQVTSDSDCRASIACSQRKKCVRDDSHGVPICSTHSDTPQEPPQPVPLMPIRASDLGKPQRSAEAEPLEAILRSVNWSSKRWDFDRAGSRMTYDIPIREHVLVVVQFDIIGPPEGEGFSIPHAALFHPVGAEMEPLGIFITRYQKWSTYGAYLGIEGDRANDLRYTKSVKLTSALSIPREYAKRPLVIAFSKGPCQRVVSTDAGAPPRYIENFCQPRALSLAEFGDRYVLVAARNLDQLPRK